jgi:hypothetical protein
MRDTDFVVVVGLIESRTKFWLALYHLVFGGIFVQPGGEKTSSLLQSSKSRRDWLLAYRENFFF